MTLRESLTGFPVATEGELDDDTVDYVLGLVNGVTKLVPASLLGGIGPEPDVTPPNVPLNLTATPGFEKLTLNWDDNGEADLLRYEYRIDAGAPVDTGTTSAAVVTGLTNGTDYDVQVRAVDTSENASAWTAIVTAAPEWDPSAISAASRFYDTGSLGAINGTSPATWPDLSDNNTDLAVSGAPVYFENVAGGYPHMRFMASTTDGYLFGSAFTHAQPFTVAAVYRFNYQGANPNLSAVSGGSSRLFGVGSGQYSTYLGAAMVSGGAHNTAWRVVTFLVNGASTVIRVDGAQTGSGNPGASGFARLAIGAAVNDSGVHTSPWDGDIAAVVVVPGEIVAGAELTALEAWLTARKPTTFEPYGATLTTDVEMLLITGQSNAVGLGSVVTSTTPEHATNTYTVSAGGYTPLAGVAGANERPQYALTNQVYEDDPDNTDVWASNTAAQNGVGFGSLAQGTDLYDANMAAVAGAVAKTSGDVIVRAVHLIHGEYHTAFPPEGAAGTLGWYEALMADLHTDYDTDIKAETGQTEDVILVFCQDSSWKWYADNGYTASRVPGLDQVEYHKANVGGYLVGPKYCIDDYDGLHVGGAGAFHLGEYHAKVIDAVVHNAGTWSPVMPTNLSRTGAVIDVTFAVPVGPLVLDTTLISAQSNYGFSYTDDSSPPAISSVTLLDADTVRITLASTPTGANKKVGYAITGNGKGNLRDSDTAVSDHDAHPLHNWCVMFQEAVA